MNLSILVVIYFSSFAGYSVVVGYINSDCYHYMSRWVSPPGGFPVQVGFLSRWDSCPGGFPPRPLIVRLNVGLCFFLVLPRPSVLGSLTFPLWMCAYTWYRHLGVLVGVVSPLVDVVLGAAPSMPWLMQLHRAL